MHPPFFMHWYQEQGKCVSCGRISPNWVRTCPYCGEEVRVSIRLRLIRLLLTILPFLLSLILDVIGKFSFHWNHCMQHGGEWASAVSAVGLYLLLSPPSDRDVVVTDRHSLIIWQLLTLLLRLYVVAVIALILLSGTSFFLSVVFLIFSGIIFSVYPLIWRTGNGFLLGTWIWILGAVLLCWLGN